MRAVAFDSLQNAWIGTFNGGVAKFDGTNWTVYDISNSMLPDNFVKTLAFDSLGSLWIGTGYGLAKFDGTNWLVFNQSNSLLQSDNIGAIHPSSNNRVFVGTINGGLAIVDNDTIKDVYTIANGSGIPDNSQVGFDEDSSGNVWMATPANAIVVYRIVGGWFWYYQGNSLIPTNSLSSLLFNHDESALWLGTLDSGIVKRTGVVYQSYTTVNSPMPDNHVQCIALDSNNVLWIGTASQGVVRFEESLLGINSLSPSNGLQAYPNPANNSLTIKSTAVFSYYKICDVQGKDLFAATTNAKETTADVSSFTSGIYLLKLFFADGSVGVQRFAKE